MLPNTITSNGSIRVSTKFAYAYFIEGGIMNEKQFETRSLYDTTRYDEAPMKRKLDN